MVVSFTVEHIVDVVIPNFNRTLVVQEAIDSVNQNSNINNIWLIDDGSDLEITKFYDTLNIHNLKIVKHERVCDPGFLRRFAISRSKAEWIAFLDSDDTWHRDKIATQLKFATEQKIDFVCSPRLEKSFPTHRAIKSFVIKGSPVSLMAHNFVITSSVLVKRELLNEVDGFCFGEEYSKCEDLGTWMRLSHFTNFGVTNELLVQYNISDDSFGKGLQEGFRYKLIKAHLKWMLTNDSFSIIRKIKTFLFILFAEVLRNCIFFLRRRALRKRLTGFWTLVRSEHEKS
jgi:glycosyltransferase involved in cell wall biosynthesis